MTEAAPSRGAALPDSIRRAVKHFAIDGADSGWKKIPSTNPATYGDRFTR